MAAIHRQQQQQQQEQYPYQQHQQQQRPYQGQPTSGGAGEKRVRYSDLEPHANPEPGRYEDREKIGHAAPAAVVEPTRRRMEPQMDEVDAPYPLNQFSVDTRGNRPGIPIPRQQQQQQQRQEQTPVGPGFSGDARRDSQGQGNYPVRGGERHAQDLAATDVRGYGQRHDDLRYNAPYRGPQHGYNENTGYQQQPPVQPRLEPQSHQGYSNPQQPGANMASLPHYPEIPQHQRQQHPLNSEGYSMKQQPPQQPPPRQQQQQQQQQQQKQAPVKGLVLPTGPSYDPVDEEDLQRETTYQQGLRTRIEEVKRRTEETVIPRLPIDGEAPQGQGHPQMQQPRYVPASQDFAQDSLDYYEEDSENGGGNTLRALEEAFGPGPAVVGGPHLAQRQHPPTNHFRDGGQGFPPQAMPRSRLDNVQLDSEDYRDEDDVYGSRGRRNPQVQQRFFDPNLAAAVSVNNYSNNSQQNQQHYYHHQHPQQQQHYYQQQQPFTDRSNFEDGRYQDEDTPYDDGSQLSSGREGVGGGRGRMVGRSHVGGNGRVGTAESEYMEASHPRPPKYDYISHNKEDYGKPPPRSYKQIMEIQKEEKEKLNEVFIHPKPKGRGGQRKRQGQSRDPSRQGSLYSNEGQGHSPRGLEDDAVEGMSAAEQVWARRSNQLAQGGKPSRRGGGGGRGGHGGLQKFNSDSSIHQAGNRQAPSQPQQHHHQPPPPQQRQLGSEQRAFMTDLPTPVNDQISNQVSVPLSPRHGELQLQPIHQQIVTEDGQRISVDVNLRLISPPLDASAGQPPPAALGAAGRGRQYPAVPQHYSQQELSQEAPGADNYRYVSPRGRYSADEVLRQLSESRTDLNPYGKVPPIDGVGGGGGRNWLYRDENLPSSAPIPDQGGSYMDMYLKQREQPVQEKPWYKVYGLKDYRRMQKEVKLGTLGPDLDSDATRERREKAQRQQDYARLVMEKNKNDLVSRRPPAFPRPREENSDIMNRRKLAQEYAKSVPKPTVKIRPNEFNNYELASEKSPIAKHHRKVTSTSSPSLAAGGEGRGAEAISVTPGGQKAASPEKNMEVLDLERLRQRYEQDKQNEAAIRQTSGRTY